MNIKVYKDIETDEVHLYADGVKMESAYSDKEMKERLYEFIAFMKACPGTDYTYRDLLRACGFIDQWGERMVKND